MVTFLQIFSLIVLITITETYDPFEGFFQQEGPCFETVNDDYCDTTLRQVYTPPYKGSNINAMNTKLWLFTVRNPDKAEPLHKCGGKLPEDSEFDKNVDTVVISHGYADGVCRTAWMREMKDQLFIRGKYNVILIDWTWGNFIDITEASVNAIVTGEDTAFVVMNIMKQTNMMNGNRFHFIGHSYGAYAINEAARYIFEREPQNKIRRLTFLDPAIVPIKDGDPAREFRAEYAQFTDAIHGDAGRCFPVSLGLFNTFGHADFYPNGGAFQISCYSYAVTSLLKGDFFYALASFIYPPLCSHLQTIQYFKVSINHPQGLYIGAECKDFQSFLSGDCYRCCKKDFSKCAVMGMDAEKYFPHLYKPKKNRIYFLNLGLECPYNEDYEFSVFRDC